MLVLASASPRRRELLTQAGYTFTVHPAQIPEDPLPGEDPIAYVVRLARQKAETIFRELTSENSPTLGAPGLDFETWEAANLDQPSEEGTGFSPYIGSPKGEGASAPEEFAVLGADTTVTLDGLIFGKPSDPSDAARMLRLLSGRTHRVITGVALATASGTEIAAEVTAVRFLTLSDAEIAAYVATGEPLDKAGAYAIQGRAALWIPRIEGCYFNVVGLPLALVSTLLESAGLHSAR
jgi:septum formation protein